MSIHDDDPPETKAELMADYWHDEMKERQLEEEWIWRGRKAIWEKEFYTKAINWIDGELKLHPLDMPDSDAVALLAAMLGKDVKQVAADVTTVHDLNYDPTDAQAIKRGT